MFDSFSLNLQTVPEDSHRIANLMTDIGKGRDISGSLFIASCWLFVYFLLFLLFFFSSFHSIDID